MLLCRKRLSEWGRFVFPVAAEPAVPVLFGIDLFRNRPFTAFYAGGQTDFPSQSTCRVNRKTAPQEFRTVKLP